MLRGTGLHARHLAAGGWRIERVDALPQRRPANPRRESPGRDIVVAASKRALTLERFPGAVSVVDPSDGGNDPAPAGTDAIVARDAAINSTALGVGRNKLFVRGIADSGFTGNSPVATAQYLDDVRLTYNMPDPGLNLYDVRSVEILEGPRGTLYGAGTIGGVMRVVARQPDAGRFAASLSAGGSITAHGAPGEDLAGMMNIPIAHNVAVRLVGYETLDGGYIDEPERSKSDTNQVRTLGGRFALRWTAGAGWTVDVRSVGQNIQGRDSQWSDGAGSLDRAGPLAQPYSSDFKSGSIVISHDDADGPQFISATSISHQAIDENYDARDVLGAEDVNSNSQRRGADLIVHETRLFRSRQDGTGWLLGIGILSDHTRVRRADLDAEGAQIWSQHIGTSVLEATLFGEMSFALPAGFVGTVGSRLGRTHLTSNVDGGGESGPVLARVNSAVTAREARTQTRLLPTAALSRKLGQNAFLFLRFDASERPGGLTISNGAAAHFDADRLESVEAGLRWQGANDRLSGSIVATHTRWLNVQADLVTEGGAPIVINIGNATIAGLELAAKWHASTKLGFDAAFFANRSSLHNDAVGILFVVNSDLPNVARFGASVGATISVPVGGARLATDLRLRYFGPSKLGVGAVLGRLQGDYLDNEIVARWGHEKAGLSLRVTNLLDLVGNRFALGTPYRLFVPQGTPLRPRTVRLGGDLRF